MASYHNCNYFAGVVVVPKLLTITAKYDCDTRPACKDSSKVIWHLDSLMPYKHLWNKAKFVLNREIIETACNLYDVPYGAWDNIFNIAQFDWKMYPYVSHALRLTEKELIMDMFDIVFKARHGYSEDLLLMVEKFVIKLKQMKQDVRLFYLHLNK